MSTPTATATTTRSRYEERVHLVSEALTSNTKLDKKAAAKVAVQILHAIDTIPEKVR
ncbi:DUF6307 family protein [Antrihabitans spumae]|jgi:hypothetical protein|uniref:DUF6307 family protein n=1 Tax=Antrihabitans spumae TaxID=3373370 RepID=A0ABW7K2C4_9NOCA